MFFTDNEGARHCLTAGYSGDSDHCSIVALFWLMSARTGVRPWFERVASESNIADAVSRFDFSDMEALGATEAGVDFDVLFCAVCEAIKKRGCPTMDAVSRLVVPRPNA